VRGLRRWIAAGTLVLAPQLSAAEPPTHARDALQVGAVVLHRCRTGAPWCATLSRPLDPTGVIAGTIDIYFELYPHSEAGPSIGTLAADDLAAILGALGSKPIDLYGDSYGTFFEQVFAVCHPDVLRSVILDGAYPMDGAEHAWYPNYAPGRRGTATGNS
jgi:pimeloyl-ACP methyl ester carboxylesterase